MVIRLKVTEYNTNNHKFIVNMYKNDRERIIRFNQNKLNSGP